MDINVLDKYVSRFATSLHINQLKLSDLATKKPVKLTDQQILETEEATPDKFETETIRFWRIKNYCHFLKKKSTQGSA